LLAFEPELAPRLTNRFEFHYISKRGSWFNIAEIELGILIRLYLSGQIADKTTLEKQVKAWQEERNEKKVQVGWQFNTADAHIELKLIYPNVHD